MKNVLYIEEIKKNINENFTRTNQSDNMANLVDNFLAIFRLICTTFLDTNLKINFKAKFFNLLILI